MVEGFLRPCGYQRLQGGDQIQKWGFKTSTHYEYVMKLMTVKFIQIIQQGVV